MKFLFTSAGSFGDLAPLIVLALELRGRGHDVQWVTNPYHLPMLKRWGFEGVGAGDPDALAEVMRNPRLNHPIRCVRAMMEAGRQELRPSYERLKELASSDAVVVYRSLAMSGRLVSEKLGLPCCSVVLTPMELSASDQRAGVAGPILNPLVRALPNLVYEDGLRRIEKRVLEPAVLPPLNQLLRKEGMPEVKRGLRQWTMDVPLTLALYPSWFAGLSAGFPDTVRQTGFACLPTDEVTPLDPALEEFLDRGEAPVALSMGSALKDTSRLQEKVLKACKEGGQRTLVLSFDHQGPPKVEGDHCVSGAVSIGRVLPRCRAWVHRGGVGATADGLRFGVPQLILGQSLDHPDNGDRVARLGAGRFVYTVTATRWLIRRALDAVLNDPEIRRGAKDTAELSDPDRWCRESADLIQSLGR